MLLAALLPVALLASLPSPQARNQKRDMCSTVLVLNELIFRDTELDSRTIYKTLDEHYEFADESSDNYDFQSDGSFFYGGMYVEGSFDYARDKSWRTSTERQTSSVAFVYTNRETSLYSYGKLLFPHQVEAWAQCMKRKGLGHVELTHKLGRYRIKDGKCGALVTITFSPCTTNYLVQAPSIKKIEVNEEELPIEGAFSEWGRLTNKPLKENLFIAPEDDAWPATVILKFDTEHYELVIPPPQVHKAELSSGTLTIKVDSKPATEDSKTSGTLLGQGPLNKQFILWMKILDAEGKVVAVSGNGDETGPYSAAANESIVNGIRQMQLSTSVTKAAELKKLSDNGCTIELWGRVEDNKDSKQRISLLTLPPLGGWTVRELTPQNAHVLQSTADSYEKDGLHYNGAGSWKYTMPFRTAISVSFAGKSWVQTSRCDSKPQATEAGARR